MMNLNKYCNEDMPSFRKPFVAGKYLYATDGSIAIRIPKPAKAKEVANTTYQSKCAQVKYWEACSTASIPLPPYDTLRTRPMGKKRCAGCGRITQGGYCFRCQVSTQGTIHDGHKWPGFADGFGIADRYFRMLLALPNVRTSIIIDPALPGPALAFRFDGGEGLVMSAALPAHDGK